MRNKILTAIALATTVAAGAFAGYKIATDDELRGRRYFQKENGCYDRRCCHAYCSGNEESQD